MLDFQLSHMLGQVIEWSSPLSFQYADRGSSCPWQTRVLDLVVMVGNPVIAVSKAYTASESLHYWRHCIERLHTV